MGSRTIRVDTQVYARILEAKALLEAATGRVQSASAALAFLVAMSEPANRPSGGVAAD